nr:MAG TPA: TFIIB-TERMINAL DOMAIN, TFIIB, TRANSCRIPTION INITIATION [Caudoviricetes sp.]
MIVNYQCPECFKIIVIDSDNCGTLFEDIELEEEDESY